MGSRSRNSRPRIFDREILVRTDIGGQTHAFTQDCRDAAIRFSVGYELGDTVRQAILELPETAWAHAINANGNDRDGAWVAGADRVSGSVLVAGRLPVDLPAGAPAPGAQFQIFDEHG